MRGGIKYIYLSVVYLFFYFPIIILIAYSFNKSTYSLVWNGFTLQWYKELWKDKELFYSAINSFILAFLTATLSSIFGIIIATCFRLYSFFCKNFLQALIFILIISPEITLAIAFLILFSLLKISLGFWTLLLAHVSFCTPFVTVTLFSRFSTLNKTILEAARDIGASDWIIFKRILLPLLVPSILASWLLSFTLSLDDVLVSFFVSGPEFQTLPLYVYSLLRLGVKPELNALFSILFICTLFLALISEYFFRKN